MTVPPRPPRSSAAPGRRDHPYHQSINRCSPAISVPYLWQRLIGAMMKTLTVTQYGPAGQLAVTDARRPAPGPGQLLLQVEAAGVNPADYKLVTGEHRDTWPLQFPFV